jgi:hypothetical protein
MASIGASKAASAKSRIDEATTPTSITFDKTVVPMFVAERVFKGFPPDSQVLLFSRTSVHQFFPPVKKKKKKKNLLTVPCCTLR